MADRILLIGMMGAGKTTVGALLAERLGWPYLDSDAAVEQRTGRTIREIFERDGEAAFRREEKQALLDALAGDGPAVVGVAGGAVLDPDNRQALRDAGLVVWLRAEVSTLAGRVTTAGHRPLLDGDPEATLARLYPQREPLYGALADLVVDVDTRTPAEIVDAIVAARGEVRR